MLPCGRDGKEWVAASYYVGLGSHGGPCRRKYINRNCRHRRPRVAQDVVAVMQICAAAAAERTSQIDVLTYSTRRAAGHWHRNRGPGGVPSVRSRVVLPSLASLTKVGVEPTDDVDFAVIGVVGQVRISPGLRHWSAGAPGLSCDIIDLGRILDDGTVVAAEYVDRVGVASVNRSRAVYSDWNIWQAGPSVTNGIVAVKRVCRSVENGACSGIGVGAIAGHRRQLDHERITGHNGPRQQGRAQRTIKSTDLVGSRIAVRSRFGRARFASVSLRQREWNRANGDE